jgi:hypothetical protein
VPLPDDPAFLGDVWFQAAFLAPGSNPLGLKTSRGLLVQVR